jgi:hypothetical protein
MLLTHARSISFSAVRFKSILISHSDFIRQGLKRRRGRLCKKLSRMKVEVRKKS